MAINNDNTVALASLREGLNTLSVSALKRKADQQFGIKLASTASKESIIDTIIGHAQKFNFSAASEGELRPGYARIKLHPVPGYPTSPVFVGVNDRSWFVPVNIEVDVPIKVMRSLEQAIENKPVQEISGETTWVENTSYPFSVIEVKDGPDPFPGFEVARDAKNKEKHAFVADMAARHGGKGWWPKGHELKAWQEEKSRNLDRDAIIGNRKSNPKE